MHATCPLRSPKRKRARLLLGTSCRSKRKQEGNGILISSKNILFLEAQPHRRSPRLFLGQFDCYQSLSG